MEQVTWLFDISPDTMVVTTTYVTQNKKDILYVTHEFDQEEGVIWQFHCDNDDYRPAVLQLVRLDEIIKIDPGIKALAELPVGHSARRLLRGSVWVTSRDQS